MEDNFKRISISSDDYEFSDTSVESFSSLVGSFFNLFKGGTLWDKVVDSWR